MTPNCPLVNIHLALSWPRLEERDSGGLGADAELRQDVVGDRRHHLAEVLAAKPTIRAAFNEQW
jgi:hypothetical protein